MSRPAAPPVVVHIERLVVDGAALDTRHARALQQAIENELRQLLQAGLVQSSLLQSDANWQPVAGARARAEAPDIALAGTPAHSGRDGAAIARSLHAAIGAPVVGDRGTGEPGAAR